MTNLTDVSSFDPVYQLETTDDVIGGAGGTSNLQPQQLANRTRYLLDMLQNGGAGYAADTGSTNTYVANLSPVIAALVDGMEVRFKPANTNTGASTFTPRSGTITALPIYGGDQAALIGGEIVEDGEVTLRYNASLNTPNGAWVIMSSTGGTFHAQTPAVGNNTTEAATMAALYNAADGMATVSVGGASNVTLTQAQYGMAMLNLTGTPSGSKDLIFPAQTGMWVVINNQGGSNNVTAKTSAVGSTGKVLPQGTAVIIYSDGTNIAFASSSSQASFTQVSITGVTGATLTVSGGYTPGNIMVEKNGAMLQPADYTATNGSTITLATAAVSTDKFTIYVFNSFTVANAVLKSGDTMTGPLTLPGGGSGGNAMNFNDLVSQFTGSNHSLSSSGYQKLPGGLILQWGITVGDTTGTITFPIPFPTAALQIVGADRGNSIHTFCFDVLTTTTCTYVVSGSSQISWLAIGY